MTATLVVRPSWSLGSDFKTSPQTPNHTAWQSVTRSRAVGARAIQHSWGGESWNGQCGCALFKKRNVLMWTSSKCTTKALHTQWKRIFSSFLVRNFFICCSLQNSLSTDQQLLTKFTFSSYCPLAFTSLSNVRTFCAYFIFSDECLEYNKVIVSWDFLTAFLAASEFYSPSTLTHTPPGNQQQKAEEPLETRQSNTRFPTAERSSPFPGIAALPDWGLHSVQPPFVHFWAKGSFFSNSSIFAPPKECQRLRLREKGSQALRPIPPKVVTKRCVANTHCLDISVFRSPETTWSWFPSVLLQYLIIYVKSAERGFLCINYSYFQFINHIFAPCLNGYCSLKQSGHA